MFFIVKVRVFPRHLFREINRSSALLWQEFWYLYLNSLFLNKVQDILSSQKSLVLVLLNCWAQLTLTIVKTKEDIMAPVRLRRLCPRLRSIWETWGGGRGRGSFCRSTIVGRPRRAQGAGEVACITLFISSHPL